MTEAEVMKDLKDIKGYFVMINHIKRNSSVITPVRIMEIVNRYLKIMEQASSEEFFLFTEIYVNGATQADLATFLGVSRETIKYRHKKLIKYLLKNLEKEVK
jgi:DNA-directed RNA polymerase specialized sigma subunit